VRKWWETALTGPERIGLTWAVLLGFLRFATSSRVFPSPLTLDHALERVDVWLNHPNTVIVTETREQWTILRDLLSETGTSGSLTTDAYLASLAIANEATLVSCDTDFGRFPGLAGRIPPPRTDTGLGPLSKSNTVAHRPAIDSMVRLRRSADSNASTVRPSRRPSNPR
jgi:toxin-antitoxin system PIN domain toxin